GGSRSIRRFWIAFVRCRVSRMLRNRRPSKCFGPGSHCGTCRLHRMPDRDKPCTSLQSIPDVIQLLGAIFLQSEHVRIFCRDQVDDGVTAVVPGARSELLTDMRMSNVV